MTNLKILVDRWKGLVAKSKCYCFFFFRLLACHATIAALPLNLPQTKENNLSGQGIIYLNL